MFNEERKNAFIAYKRDEQAKNTDVFAVRFRHAEEQETKLNKDLSEFTYDEISEMFINLNLSSINGLLNLRTTYAQYTTWCMENQLIPIGPNLYKKFSSQKLEGFINQEELDRKIVSEEIIDEWCRELKNPSEAFMIRAVYEGLGGPGYSEITSLTIDDIEGNIFKLSTGRTLQVSDKLVALAKVSYETDSWDSGTGKDNRLGKGKKIVRKRDNAHKETNPYLFFIRRFNKAIKYLGADGITPKNITLSGEINFIKTRCKELGISPSDYLNSSYIREVEDRFEGTRIGNCPSVYLRRYERYLE